MDKAGPLAEEEEEEEEDQDEEEAEAEVEAEAEATRCRTKNCKENPYRGTECRDTKSYAMLDTSQCQHECMSPVGYFLALQTQ